MSLKSKNFQFGDFLLDAEERTLLHKHKPVAITPKTFLLLQTLVENHGRIVEKDQLMRAVWADSFVEDGNLTFTINLLRKALSDDTRNPRFIETIPRRGYRFVSDVKEIRRDELLKNGSANPVSVKPAASLPVGRLMLPALAVILVGAVAGGFWYSRDKSDEPEAAVLSAPFTVEKLSTNGSVFHAAISPDGKNVVYTSGLKGKQSIWLREVETSNNIQIIPPADFFYYGLVFSPDSNSVYFTRRPKLAEIQADIYRVSIFGGIPVKIVSESQGWISVSPDGENISFVRCYYLEEENCSLWVADALDGKNERKLVSRPRPLRIGDVEFSPGGKSITFAVGQSLNQANEFGLAEVDVETGAERELTDQKFFNIKSLEWLPNQNELLITASRIPDKTFRIWQVSAANGVVMPLTKDSESYSALSLDKSATMLISTQVTRDFHLRLFSTDVPTEKRDVADAMTVGFAPDGAVVFSSMMTGNEEIWSAAGDESSLRQLTNNTSEDTFPVVSSDNKFIFFSANRTGSMQIWRMNLDGSNQTQITRNEGGIPVFVSLDGTWVYYRSTLRKTLWRISTGNGEEQLVLDKRSSVFAVSPDGQQAAIAELAKEGNTLTIVSLENGKVIKSFNFADLTANLTGLVWSHDGKYLAYTLANSELEKNTLWFQPFDGETPKQMADLGDEEMLGLSSFALSPDGKSFAVVNGGWKHDAVLLHGLR